MLNTNMIETYRNFAAGAWAVAVAVAVTVAWCHRHIYTGTTYFTAAVPR